jgi:hypothetical protein
MTAAMSGLVLALVSAANPAPPDCAADLITLRDGTVVRGGVVENSPRAGLVVVVRRDWARKNVPELAKRWEADEAPIVKRAAAQRRERLEAWQRERPKQADGNDRISAWMTNELARLNDPDKLKTPLMLVKLSRGNVRGLVRRPPEQARLLLLGWRLGFNDAETLPVASLKDAVEGRGFVAAGNEPISVEHLLPIQLEPDARWLTRRAATEVLNDPGLRYIQVQGLVMPEPAPGEPLNAANALSVLGDLKRLLNDNAGDPVREKLEEVTKKGRVGAVVTQQSTAADLSSATVEMTLWGRDPRSGWIPLGKRAVTVRASEINRDEMKTIEDDPQVQSAFKVLQSLGLGAISADLKQTSVNIGAAVQKALGQARVLAESDLNSLALPVEGSSRTDDKPKGGR